ncbi:MAG: AAA family ATPase [Candidatus Dadabacteria bacterium]|nr:AAA family ATPase [Candidatus Dadabacteria bacterium]
MKLRKFTVKEFRSIWDSNAIEVDDKVTCLVGKNESGKTALLHALYRTNPIIAKDALFDETYDYPKREVEDYRLSIQNGERKEAVVVESVYDLEEDDIEIVSEKFGPDALKESFFTLSTYYGERNRQFRLEANDKAAIMYLSKNPDLPIPLSEKLVATNNWDEFIQILRDAETEQTETVSNLLELAEKIEEGENLAHYIYNSLLRPRIPKFLYFDEYYQMQGCANINALIQREEEGQLEGSDRPLLGLISLARLNVNELVNITNTTELKNKLEGASNHLTRRIMKYWSQNKHIRIRFDVRDAKSRDPQGMQEGVNIWGEIYDTMHLAHTPLGSRSRGFVWFFSFLAWYESVKKKQQNVILLLDEPGLSLHGRAQADLLEYFEAELSDHQLIYSTHSPFMVDPQHFDRVRIVQDLSIDADQELPREEDGTKVLTNVFDATEDSLFPLQGALGYEIQQTLFIGPNCLIVEGPSDMFYIRAISCELEREGREGLSEKWVITPVGGSGKVPAFVSLLAPQKGLNVTTLLDIKKKDKQIIEDLYKKKLLKKKQVLTYAEFIGKKEADIEDLFDREFYVGLLNAEFKRELKKPIDPSKLNERVPRILKAIEDHLSENPSAFKSGSFSHYRPAQYFTENITYLWETISSETKDTFEGVFQKLNNLL